MSYDPFTSPVNYATVGGQRTPGLCTIEGADAESKWNERNGPALSGAFIAGGGNKLVKFSMRIVLLTSDDWAAWYAFRPIVARPPTGQRPKALDVWHPWLVDAGVRSAVVTSRKQPQQKEDNSWEVVIDWIEFRRPKIVLVKPEASTPAPSDDPIDKVIKSMTDQISKMSRR